jgi:hypothetical protein
VAERRVSGLLVGVTEVDVVAGTHTFKVDEPEVLGGTDLAANPVPVEWEVKIA